MVMEGGVAAGERRTMGETSSHCSYLKSWRSLYQAIEHYTRGATYKKYVYCGDWYWTCRVSVC